MTVVIIGKRQDVAGPTHVSHRAERRWRLGDPVDVSLPIDLNARANAHGALRGTGLVIQRQAEVGRSVKVGGPFAAVRTKWLAEHDGHESQCQKSHVSSVRRILDLQPDGLAGSRSCDTRAVEGHCRSKTA